ncbi:MAG: MMPL family transporter [Actinomycetaceae bacterium]|nr:MMPL family transporter [Actinomycetaceae bacterium]
MGQVHLSLLDNGSQAKGTAQRDTYDAIAQAYGPGYNSPIIVVADIEGDPLTGVSGLAQSLGQFDGVERVAFATPNMDGTLAFVQIIPEHNQQSTATTQLVTSIRDRASNLESRHGLSSLMVTGQTAVAIDIADQLSGALAPFAIVVVGLSLVLLLLVFRSIAVPLVATAGFLLSIGTAMGALGAVYGWGWAADFLRVAKTGAVMSFTPIVVMGVLFGLAMDYQVFLVSRMREVWIHTGDARRAVREGFTGSAKVVTAAAIIMTSVFAAFIPESSPMVKPIAIALTIGIAADAFLVRMTLVPAVMFMLGARAWWIPRWLDRILPNVDIEGQKATGEQFAARALVTSANAR